MQQAEFDKGIVPQGSAQLLECIIRRIIFREINLSRLACQKVFQEIILSSCGRQLWQLNLHLGQTGSFTKKVKIKFISLL